MRIGTKSVLFGIHNPIIHSFFMFVAWVKLYGWSKELLDPRLHFCFLLHDIGYWGCESMDGPDGEMHPALGANVIGAMFGREWGNLCRFHSGTMVEMYNNLPGSLVTNKPSKLYAPDKLASPLYPAWLYKILSGWSGEWKEYAAIHFGGEIEREHSPHTITLRREGTRTTYKYVKFEEWHTDAMRKMTKRAYQHAENGDWMTMAESVKEGRSD